MTPQQRPAELSAIVAAMIGVAVAFGAELTPEQVAALVLLVGLVPGAVTWWVARGESA